MNRYDGPDGVAGAYTDCFATDVAREVDLGAFVRAFYTTAVFRVERFLLRLARLPSTDEAADAVAGGSAEAFAAWTVEARTPTELLMCDVAGRTRSWFMVEPLDGGGTTLRFGSAIVPDPSRPQRGIGPVYRALLGFHVLYSRILLHAAARKLRR